MLELQKFLRGGGTSEGLTAQYGIKNSRSKQYPNLVLFKYDQIQSPMGEMVVQEARGLILDEADNWKVVGRGFDRFFNHGEGYAAEIDWSTARVQEKVDGSLIMCYHYDGDWQVATTGSADASGEVFGFGFTFSELFRRTFSAQRVAWVAEGGFADELGRDDIVLVNGRAEKALPDPFTDTELCYLFELMTPYNRVVVPHKTSKVVLLGARNRVTGHYVNVQIEGVPNVREFPLNSFDGIVRSFETINGLDQEGYVVVDGAGNRVKVKHPQYVALHHLRDNMGPKWLVKVVVSGEVPELLTAFPEYEEDLNIFKERYEGLVVVVEALYATTKDIQAQKDFALAVKDTPYSAILFALRSGKADTVKHWLADEKNFPSVLRLLGVKD